MRKYIILIFCLTLYSMTSSAQQKSFNLVIVAGMNASQVNGDKLAGFDKVGIVAGAGIKRQVNKRAGWQFEILYSEKGSKDVAGPSNLQIDTIFRFNYIDIPIMFNYNVYEKLMIQTGVYSGVRIKAVYDDYVNKFDRTSQIRTIDYGVCLGINYSLTDKWNINFRVSQSVLDINSTIERYYNLSSALSIRYQL